MGGGSKVWPAIVMATGVHRGTAYDHFEENDQLCRLIDTLPETSNEQIAREASQERVTGQLTVLSRPLTHVSIVLMQALSTSTKSSRISWTRTWVSV